MASAMMKPNGSTWWHGATWPKSASSIFRADRQVYVEGRLQTRGWEDSEGKRHYRTEIVANEMVVLGDRRPHHDNGYASESSDEESYPF